MSIEVIQNAVPTDFNQLDAQLAQQSNYDANRYAQDGALLVQFYMRPLLDQEASEAAGRAIYRDTEFIRIINPGDKTTVIDRPTRVVEDEQLRFPKQYEMFKRGAAEQVTGTPIGLLPGISEAQVEEYKYLGLRTVEQLAVAPDSTVLRVMGMVDMKQRAQRMLDALEGRKDAQRDDRLSTLEAQNRALTEQLAALAEKQAKPGKG